MCPSYRATKDEAHSTRGRAHLLWEMTQGHATSPQATKIQRDKIPPARI